MQDLLLKLLNLYIFIVFGRIILSWFPMQPGTAMATVYTYAYKLTEPVLAPVRRIMPPMGGLDLSPIIVVLALEIVGTAVIRSL